MTRLDALRILTRAPLTPRQRDRFDADLIQLARWIVAHDPGKLEEETDPEWHDRLSDWHSYVHETAKGLLARLGGR